MNMTWIAALLLTSLGAAGDEAAAKKDGGQAKSATVADKALAPWQEKLLDVAFKAASALPDNPHVKNRCRMQHDVVTACLELDQPQRALRCVEKIGNWRRGLGYADYAFYCAKHGGERAEIERFLSLAHEIADSHHGDDAQDWERDRILGGIASTRLVLGEKEKAGEITAKLDSGEAARIDPLKASLTDVESCDRQIAEIEHAVATGDFDQIRYALKAYAQLFDHHYADAERRAKVVQKIESAWSNMPLQIQIEILEQLAEAALAHSDPPTALPLVKRARDLVDTAKWPPEDCIPIVATLAGLRFRAGEHDPAKAEVDAARALFDEKREAIVNIYRAKVLRSLAETYQAMGNTGDALRCYIRAVDAGVENPNSRPRADDLQQTCASMAIHGVPPDGELTERLTSICDKLGPPW